MQVGSTDEYAAGFDALFGGGPEAPGRPLCTTLPRVIHTLAVRGRRYFVNGVEVDQPTYQRACDRIPPADGTPAHHGRRLAAHEKQRSDALAVDPSQIPEALADAAAKKVNVSFEPDGTAVFDSYADFDRYTRSQGFYNRKW